VLERFAATNLGPWYVRHAAGLASLVFGAVSLVIAFWIQFGTPHDITTPTDLRVTLPLLAAAILAGVTSFVRREKLRPLAVSGIAMAAAAPLLGWVVVVAAVALVAALALAILAKLH
jgi:hypothetical protein